ncbi:MAG TPA: hypothetical protein VJ895_00665 [Candidatus Nanoarchaeia archaeon]|nr:hypothetical protein [Candidatus Nanoarchaeia archaeon]
MKRLILILCLVVSFSLVFASQSYEINYNSEVNDSKTFGPLQFDTVLLKINATEEGICKYSTSKGIDYENMAGNFDQTDGEISYLNLVDLTDGVHKYYIKCNNTLYEPGELEVIFRINSLVTGKILLSENSPLKSGDLEITLVTSKVVSQTPILSYSVDGTSDNPIVLFGSGKTWKGYLVLDKELGEGVLSFQMKAVDLEGRQGTELTLGNSFQYDMVKPKMIADIEATSYKGKIELNWHFEEDVDEFNIYRSTIENPGYVDYYKTTSSEDYTDTDVELGKTYYYKVSAVDYAGNEGELSVSVSGTPLKTDSDEVEGGLDPSLFGKVDSFLSEIESVKEKVEEIDVSLFTEKEQELLEKLKLKDSLNKAKNDLISLESSVEKYREQDLSRTELENKIQSSRTRLGIIEKSVPSVIEITKEESRIEEFDEEFILENLNRVNSFLEEKDLEKSLEQSFELAKENNLKIESYFYQAEVKFLDGTVKDFFIVKRDLKSSLEKSENSFFIEEIPSSLINEGKMSVKNLDYDFLTDNVLSFGSDSKNIFYYFEEISNFENLKEIESGFVSIYEAEENSGGSITGFFVFENSEKSYTWIAVLIFLVSIGAYFLYSRMNNFSDDYFRVLNKINGSIDLLKKNELKKSKGIYFEVKDIYRGLNSNEKQNIYGKIENLYNNIAIIEIEKGLEELKKTKDRELLKKLEKMYENLSSLHKNKISDLFEKIRSEVENEK